MLVILIGLTIIGNLMVILVVARGLLSAEFLSILALPLFLVLGRGITYASPRVNGVQLTPTQFPEAYGMVVDAAARFGLERGPHLALASCSRLPELLHRLAHLAADHALKLGFDAVAFAPADLGPDARRERQERLAEFVAQGCKHAGRGTTVELNGQFGAANVMPGERGPETR